MEKFKEYSSIFSLSVTEGQVVPVDTSVKFKIQGKKDEYNSPVGTTNTYVGLEAMRKELYRIVDSVVDTMGNMQGNVRGYYDVETKLSRAINLACNAHALQKDKKGNLYIMHVLRVMAKVDGEDSQTVATLHDVVEDTEITLKDLEKEFPKNITDAVDSLTKRRNESLEDYIKRLCKNKLAVTVKEADIKDNSDEDRLKLLNTVVADRLRKKYMESTTYLNFYKGK